MLPKLHKINKKHKKILICLILVLGFLFWYKYPVKVPNYELSKIDLDLLYIKITNGGSNLRMRIPNTDEQKRILLDKLKDIRFYKKFIQPTGVKAGLGDIGQFELFIYSAEEDNIEFILSMTNDGTITIDNKPSASKGTKEYGIGFPGNKQELQLYKELYEFYQYTLKSEQWHDGKIIRSSAE